MQNPLEKFLLNLAEKIQTEKEYKDIVSNSQNVDVNKNVFEGFITGVAETIKKELKERAVVVPVSAADVPSEQNEQEDSFVKFVSTLANTISANKNRPVESKPTEENEEKQEKKQEDQQEKQPVKEPKTQTEPEKKEQTEPAKEDSFQKFIGNLKDIIQKTPAENPPKQKKKESKGKVNDYVSELKRDENEEKKENQQDPENKIKNLVRKFIESEIKNFKDEMGQKIGQMGSSYGGGGSNSYNYYPGGGPMFGSLQFPNSGTGIFFADGSSLTSAKALTGGGGGGGDPAVNALVYSNSADWNAAYTNLIYNSASYLTGTAVNLGDLPSLSSNWNNTYTQYSTYSASYARTDQNVIFQNNVTILGNLTALGTATFANTIFTTTSALSVINTGPGPALYVYQAAGPYDVASFYDGDGVEVLHVGNATPGGNGFVGINESFPSVELSVRGAVSASKTITALGGNSDQWNSAYTNLIYNSSAYLSGTAVNLGDIPSLSSNWNSNYTTTSYFSAFWNAAVDEIFTFYVTQTSAASAFWTEDGNYYFIQNSKLDNWQLWNSMYTTLYLNSAGWESTETTVRSGSSNWNSTYSSLSPNSAKYESVYSTYNANSASYATEILAIAYAVAL